VERGLYAKEVNAIRVSLGVSSAISASWRIALLFHCMVSSLLAQARGGETVKSLEGLRVFMDLVPSCWVHCALNPCRQASSRLGNLGTDPGKMRLERTSRIGLLFWGPGTSDGDHGVSAQGKG
jgi:hypothetical protein